MQYLLIPGILIVSFLLWMMLEVRCLKVEQLDLPGNVRLNGVLLSDLHIRKLRVRHKRLCRALGNSSPDAVVFAGDFIDRVSDIPRVLPLIHELIQAGRKANPRCRFFACFGNHDLEAHMDPGGAIRAEALDGFARQLQDAGIRMLINTSETVADPNGKLAVFTGFDELRYGRTDIPKALSSLEGRAYAYRIGFGHNPDICLHLPEGSFHLFLCGHFHGGQIWAPFRFEFFRLRNEKLCKQGIYRGLHRIRKTDVYISRGIGNVLVPLRLGSLPEMTVFRIGAKP